MEKKKKNYNLIIGVLGLVFIILVISVVGYIISRPQDFIIQGEVEVTEYRVSGKVPGRIEAFLADEGDYVCKGDTLVIIDSPEVRGKLAEAQAARSAAVAQRSKAYNGARSEQIEGAYELWQQAIVQEDVMKKSLDRVQNLYDQEVISAQKYDETKAKYEAAVAQTKAAKSQYDMAVAGARSEDKAAASALVDRADAALMQVDAYLDELCLTAPCDGTVKALCCKPGDSVTKDAVLAVIG